MYNNFLTPKRILIATAVVAILLLIRFCQNAAPEPPAELSIRYEAAPSRLNPFLTVVGVDIYTCARIFQTFGELDPNTLVMEPLLIKAIPQQRLVNDGPHKGELAYDFELIDGIKWDNGTPMTAKDFEFCVKLVFHPFLPTKAYASFFKNFSGLDIDPNNPAKFTVYYKDYYFMTVETLCQFPLMPAYHYDANNRLSNISIEQLLDSTKVADPAIQANLKAFADEFQQPKFLNDPNGISGSGPYRVETINEQGVILVKKAPWWGDEAAKNNPLLAAYPKKLIYKVVKDENALENMLKNEQLDIVTGAITPAKFLELKKNDSLAAKYNFDQRPPLTYSRWQLNLSKPMLKDIRIRKALAHIVDYDHIINNLRAGMAKRTVSSIMPSKDYYNKNITPYDFNLDKARQLLSEAGWNDSDNDGIRDKVVDGKPTKLVIELLVTSALTSKQYAQSVTENARLAGIEIKNVPIDLTELSPKTKNGDFETAFLGSALFPGWTELGQRYHSANLAPAGDNRSRLVSPRLDSLIDRIAAEPDVPKRIELYQQAQVVMHEELPEVFLFTPDNLIITSKRYEPVISGNRPGYYEHLFRLKK